MFALLPLTDAGRDGDTERGLYEADLSAEQRATPSPPRVSSQNGEPWGPPRTFSSASEGPQTADRLDTPETSEAVGTRQLAFPPSLRVRSRRDYLRAQREQRGKRTRHFIVISAPGGTEESRLGITVTKKVGGAVRRNRIKRRVREFFRLNRRRLQPARDLVIIARAGADKLSYREIERELTDALLS